MTHAQRNARTLALHTAAAKLEADGRCSAHIDDEIAELEAKEGVTLPAERAA